MPDDRRIDERPHTLLHRDELARELDAAIARGAETGESLQRAVARFVAHAKARGLPPQEVIVALKEELRCHAMPHLHQDSYAALSAHVVRWGIDEYYGRG
jgi:hypothetical protein